MKKIGTAYENFAFRSFDISGRASVLEYWAVMPVIWAVIIFLTIGDLQEAWGMLLNRQVPPLNPLYWDGIVVFLLTLIPRFTLTVRRLHDSGRNGKWVKLPVLSLFMGFWLFLMFCGLLLSVNENAQLMAIGASIAMAVMFDGGINSSELDLIFAAVATADAIGFEAIWKGMAEMLAATPAIELGAVAEGARTDPGAVLMVLGSVAAPFITFFIHIFFMISPGIPEDEMPGHHKIAGATLRKQGNTSDNPYEGYKYLTERSADEQAADKAAARDEIRALYRSRVLGQQSA